MPQLDIIAYEAELFWFIVTIVILYAFVLKIFVPVVVANSLCRFRVFWYLKRYWMRIYGFMELHHVLLFNKEKMIEVGTRVISEKFRTVPGNNGFLYAIDIAIQYDHFLIDEMNEVLLNEVKMFIPSFVVIESVRRYKK